MEYTLEKTPKGQSRMAKQETLGALVHKTRDEDKHNTTKKIIER
jgi:hypothetical protein